MECIVHGYIHRAENICLADIILENIDIHLIHQSFINNGNKRNPSTYKNRLPCRANATVAADKEPFCYHGLLLISAWISNHIPSKV